MSLVKMRSTGWTLSNLTGVLIKRGNIWAHGESHIYTEEQLVKIKAETGELILQAKECQSLPANHQKLGVKHGIDSTSEPSGVSVTGTFISVF